jgi:protein-tyrosine phosphatase
MMNYTNKLHTKYLFVFLIALTVIVFGSCSREQEPAPGGSLGIASVPNLRDMGGYKTTDGATVASGLVYRSNQLYNISESDMLLLAKLNLKNDFDLRTSAERNSQPDELPAGVNNIWLDVMADLPTSGPANLNALLSDPIKANAELGNGKAEEMFKTAYRHCISLPSALASYRELFLALGNENQLPALFHCATGKDRTGWAAAALLTLLDVPMEAIKADYLRSNDYILPMYDTLIQRFVADGGSPSIPLAILGVKEEYLDAAFDEMQTKYGSIENYFSEGLGISAEQQASMRSLYLLYD